MHKGFSYLEGKRLALFKLYQENWSLVMPGHSSCLVVTEGKIKAACMLAVVDDVL